MAKKIMIVDDDRTTVELLSMLLEMEGYEVVSMPRGKQALGKAQETSPDVIIVDRHLNDMDGIELIRSLRGQAAFARTPIVMASGMNVEDEALAAGATLFLVKPLDPDGLISTLKGLV